MMPCIADDSVLDTDHSLTDPWDAASPDSNQKTFSGFRGLELLTSVTDLPDTLFELYLQSSPPPVFTTQHVYVPESSSSREKTHLVSVPEGDPSQTLNGQQKSHSRQGTHTPAASDHEIPPDVTLSQSVLGGRALLNCGQMGQDCGLSSVQEWRSLRTNFWPQLQPLMDILPPTQYPSSIYGNDQQLRFLTRHGPWIGGMEVNHSQFSGDAIWKQGQETARESGRGTHLDLLNYTLLHPSPEGGAEPCEEYYGHGGQAFGYLTPSPSTLKRRRRLSTEETAFLVSQFRINEKPTAQERQVFAKHLNLDRRTIQVWFQNRRAKLKRETFAHIE